MKLPRFFSALAVFVVLSALHAVAQAATPKPATMPSTPQSNSAQIAKMPVHALHIKDFKLLSSGTGWVSTGSQLLLTTDNGAHWKDISPPSSPGGELSGVFFLDANTGWLLYATATDDTTPDGRPIDYYTHLFATTDGGASWTTVSQLPILSSSGEVTGGGSLVFSDKLHGWVELGTIRSGILFATSDGGRTWQSPKSQPGIGSDMVAPTDKDLWMAGGRDYKLIATHDGANTFQDVSLPVPAGIDPDDYPTYGLPVFTDSINGYESVMYTGGNGDRSAIVLFATSDGGHTWKPDRILSNLDESSAGGRSFSTIAGSEWIFSYAPDGSKTTLVKIHPNEKKTATVNVNSHDGFNGCELSFLRQDEGWMNCLGILSSTIDSGATWTVITPRARNGILTTDPITPAPTPKQLKTIQIKPAVGKGGAAAIHPLASPPNHVPYEVGLDQHLGFDSTDVLSKEDMGTWWKDSPYYDVGIYLPDTSPKPPKYNRHNDNKLLGKKGVAWVDAVIGQRWGIIPIWFGLQAPCPPKDTTYNRYISIDTNEAANQGVAQADLTYNSATNLGLDGRIVYFDIEPYSTSSPKCSAAVSAYVGAFVQEMHSKAGGSVGVYANVDAAPTDIYNAIPRPDDIWIANNSGRVTVWNLTARDSKHPKNFGSALTDDMWPHFQRMHQYRIDTDAIPVVEKWGGVPVIRHTFDDDIVDATVVQSSGTKKIPDTMSYKLVSNGSYSSLNGIANGKNNSGFQDGEAVGFYSGDSFLEGFTYLNGKTISTQLYAGTDTETMNINNLGQIVGIYGTYSVQGFYAPNSAADLQPLSYPGALGTFLYGINDAGWIIGTIQETACYYIGSEYTCNDRCALWKPDANGAYSNPIPFDAPGQSDTVCTGINGLGQIVGSYLNSDSTLSTPFVDDAESGDPNAPANFSTIPDTDDAGNFVDLTPYGINNNGLIDGEGGTGISGLFFLLSGSDLHEFTAPMIIQQLNGINDDAQMVGYLWVPPTDDSTSGFILNALPIQP